MTDRSSPALFLAPHNDDETLFGAFVVQRDRAHVVTVLRSHYQQRRWPAEDNSFQRRELETGHAIRELGATWTQLQHNDRRPDWNAVRAELATYSGPEWSRVYAPLPEPANGHEHHDKIGRLAFDLFGLDRVRLYPTYSRTGGRTKVGVRVDPTAAEIAGKLRAMACYGSQIENWLCRPHFLGPLDEYLVTP